MVDELYSLAVQIAVEKHFPEECVHPNTAELRAIWSEVLERIVEVSLDNFFQDARPHVDLKPEISVALVNTAFGLADAIVSMRTAGERISAINVNDERLFHSSVKGISAINHTTNLATQALKQRYSERWEPKTSKKLQTEANPIKPRPRKPRVVKQNHFISSFFLKILLG